MALVAKMAEIPATLRSGTSASKCFWVLVVCALESTGLGLSYAQRIIAISRTVKNILTQTSTQRILCIFLQKCRRRLRIAETSEISETSTWDISATESPLTMIRGAFEISGSPLPVKSFVGPQKVFRKLIWYQKCAK